MSVPECYKTQKICDKAVDRHPSTIKFVPECYKNQQMCYKAVNRCFFVFDSIPDQYKTQEICDIVVSLYPFLIVYCPDKYKTKKICHVDDCLVALEFIPDWFVSSKMIKKLFTALYADDGLLFFDNDSGSVTFCCNEMGILSVNRNNIYLDNNFDEDDPDTIILVRILAWYSKLKKRKTLEKG